MQIQCRYRYQHQGSDRDPPFTLPECCNGRRYSLSNKHEAVLEPPRAVSSFACDGLQPAGDLSLFFAQPNDTRIQMGNGPIPIRRCAPCLFISVPPPGWPVRTHFNIPLRSTRRLTTTYQRTFCNHILLFLEA